MYIWYVTESGPAYWDYWNVVYTGANWAGLSCLVSLKRGHLPHSGLASLVSSLFYEYISVCCSL